MQKALVTIKNETITMVTKQEADANALTIATIEDMTAATRLLSEVNKIADTITVEKEKITDPLNAALKEVRSRYKPLETALANAIATIKGKMNAANAQFEKEAEEKKAKLIARVEKGTMKVETAVAKMEDIPDADERINTEEGSVQFVSKDKLFITNASLIPREYLDINEVRIKEALKRGVVVPGAEFRKVKEIRNLR